MARMKKDPKALRDQAKRLMEKADKMENDIAASVGRLVIQLHDSNFRGFDLEKFKLAVAKEITGVAPIPKKEGVKK